jgi:hypothetical protein
MSIGAKPMTLETPYFWGDRYFWDMDDVFTHLWEIEALEKDDFPQVINECRPVYINAPALKNVINELYEDFWSQYPKEEKLHYHTPVTAEWIAESMLEDFYYNSDGVDVEKLPPMEGIDDLQSELNLFCRLNHPLWRLTERCEKFDPVKWAIAAPRLELALKLFEERNWGKYILFYPSEETIEVTWDEIEAYFNETPETKGLLSFRELLDFLSQQGFSRISCYGNCPVQMELLHSSGLYLYYRARGEQASLDVYELDDVPYDLPNECAWFGSFRSWKFPDAGWLSYQDVLYSFWMLWMDAREAV